MTAPAQVRTAHTAGLTPSDHRAIRELLHDAFEGDFTDQDHEHCLGGIHALVLDDSTLVAHGSVVLRRLFHAGRTLRTGYVEAVGVRADRRGEGHGHAVMAALEEIIQGGYEIGALSASKSGTGLYVSRGWELWPGTASVLSPHGLVRTPEDEGSIYLWPMSTRLAEDEDLACDWRDGDVW